MIGRAIPEMFRRTSSDKLAGVLRLLLAVTFFMAGILKIVVPFLGAAFSGQLIAADVPFYKLTLYSVPIIEMALGIALALGYHTRLASFVGLVILVAATWVHLLVEDPSLFPLQPVEPVAPLVMTAMTLYLLWRGGGAWSLDLRAEE